MKKLAGLALALAFGCQGIVGIEDRRYEAPEQSSPECKAYCDSVMQGCKGELAAYPDRATCIATCAKIPSGETLKDNSLECRTAQAALAVSSGEPGSHCPGAGPFGAGTCGSTCQAYCTLMASACPEKLTGITNCEALCGGLRADGEFDLAKLDSGDSLECRLSHASRATLDPGAHCAAAALKSTACADPAAEQPGCQDFCKLVGVACTGENQVYESEAQCLAVCGLLDKGTNADQHQDTMGCRKYHSYNSLAAPAQHCPHAGPAGDGHCGADNCEGYCQLVSRACQTEFAQAFGDVNKCQAQCSALPGANADTWNETAKTGDTVRCRSINAARASVDKGACVAALGGGECQ